MSCECVDVGPVRVPGRSGSKPINRQQLEASGSHSGARRNFFTLLLKPLGVVGSDLKGGTYLRVSSWMPY